MCPATTVDLQGAGTYHEGTLTGAQTWTAAGSPHVVSGEVLVGGGATLTIEPCAVVRFEPEARLVASGVEASRLIAEGDADHPIRFEGSRWKDLAVEAPSTASLRHVRIAGGGTGGVASLIARGDGEMPGLSVLRVVDVTVSGATRAGVRLELGAAFTNDSANLVVTGSGGYPVELGENAIGSLPAGSYTGNARDEILIDLETVRGGSGIQVDTIMRDRGVPWHVGSLAEHDDLQVGSGLDAAPAPTLTIEPGVQVRFEHATRLEVVTAEGGSPTLRAHGTAAKPIVFTSAADAPSPGDWIGLWFHGEPSAQNRLDHVRLEYTGGEDALSAVECNSDVGDGDDEAAIFFDHPPPAMFLTNSTIVFGAGHGIVPSYHSDAYLDWGDTNTFDIAGCVQTDHPRLEGCPDPEPACRGGMRPM